MAVNDKFTNRRYCDYWSLQNLPPIFWLYKFYGNRGSLEIKVRFLNLGKMYSIPSILLKFLYPSLVLSSKYSGIRSLFSQLTCSGEPSFRSFSSEFARKYIQLNQRRCTFLAFPRNYVRPTDGPTNQSPFHPNNRPTNRWKEGS